MNKLFLFSIISISVVLLGSTNMIQAKNEDSLLEKLEINSQKIQKNKTEIEKHKTKKKKIQEDLMILERNITYVNQKLTKTDQEVRHYKNQINKKEVEIAQLSQKYRSKSLLLKKRVQQIYKNKNIGLLELIFSSKDFGSFLDYAYFIEKILRKDIHLIQEIKNTHGLLIKEKQKLSVHKEKMTILKAEITQYKDTLSEKERTKQTVLTNIQNEINRIERENEQLLRESNEISLLIQQTKRKKGVISGTKKFIKPINGWISSPFGYRKHPIFKRLLFHTGIDIAAPYGTEIKAADSGVVIYAGRWGGYGNATIIDHGDNISTVYAHQARIIVQKGDAVTKGDLIGYVGSTGFSTGPHLHFEVRVNGGVVNPLNYVHF